LPPTHDPKESTASSSAACWNATTDGANRGRYRNPRIDALDLP